MRNTEKKKFTFFDTPSNNHGCPGHSVTVEVEFYTVDTEIISAKDDGNGEHTVTINAGGKIKGRPDYGVVVDETTCTHQNCSCGTDYEIGQEVYLPYGFRRDWGKAEEYLPNKNSFSNAGESRLNPSDFVVYSKESCCFWQDGVDARNAAIEEKYKDAWKK